MTTDQIKLYKARETDRIEGCRVGYDVCLRGRKIGQVAQLFAGGWRSRPGVGMSKKTRKAAVNALVLQSNAEAA